MRKLVSTLDWSRGLIAFLVVAQTQSMSAAARQLGLSPGHVSLCIKSLEADLGVALLVRTTQHIGLTAAGRAYFVQGQRLWKLFHGARRRLARDFHADGSRRARPLPQRPDDDLS